jgi:nucleotide-binding universal stress UspA family protein
MDTLLLATDGSPSAQHATEKAIELALATGWPMRVVSVWQTPMIVGSYYGYAVPASCSPDLLDVERERAADAADAAVDQAHALGVDAQAEVRHGDPVEEICAAASDADAPLIVLGAHGWGALKRLVFGSVSTGVLHHAPCGVLVIRGTSQAAETLLAGSIVERAT